MIRDGYDQLMELKADALPLGTALALVEEVVLDECNTI